mmetsp:Transcript_58253/g.129875  ORF Transcript_58253/g.129875 Transcript_58253/m.129875 type:complete len:126 (+) Transcript_58253:539-916(+)
MVYGILSVPFVFALLQQTMMDNEALDPYSPDHQLTRRAWVGGSTFLGAITLCCMLMFMVFDEDVWYLHHRVRRRWFGVRRPSVASLSIVIALSDVPRSSRHALSQQRVAAPRGKKQFPTCQSWST